MAGVSNAGITLVTTGLPRSASYKPLTTPYTYPPSCQNLWLQYITTGAAAYELYNDPDIATQYLECQPKGYSSGVYSPGVCPSGSYIATMTEYGTQPNANDDSNRVWAAVCCGNGFTYVSSEYSWSYCTSTFRSTLITANRAGVSTFTKFYGSSRSSYVALSYDYDVTTNITSLTYGTLAINPVTVQWKVSDLPKFESGYASAVASRLHVTVPTTAPIDSNGLPSVGARPVAPTATDFFTEADSSTGLSTGAKAGIGVGAFVGALIFLGVGFLVYRHWKRRRTTKSEGDLKAVSQPELLQVKNVSC